MKLKTKSRYFTHFIPPCTLLMMSPDLSGSPISERCYSLNPRFFQLDINPCNDDDLHRYTIQTWKHAHEQHRLGAAHVLAPPICVCALKMRIGLEGELRPGEEAPKVSNNLTVCASNTRLCIDSVCHITVYQVDLKRCNYYNRVCNNT